ncbi:nucleoside hydrolase [Sciscionella sediminilitoris]|uniref:nucleoside hydrolase n=1 Tax=Sciscionella sediminilitoris TaxID=1445613 RepID=UPI0004DF2B39|nr:nucleoside hydrolase [Sciscionella sp. SE31]
MGKLIIDTDPGVDDAFAIALAARDPEVELLGVTTVFGNVPLEHTTRNALRLLSLCERAEIPVAAGAGRPLVHPGMPPEETVHGADGLSGRSHTLPEHPRGLDERHAVTLLADLLHAATEPVTIAPIGPLTNIATLLAAHPWAKAKIDRIVLMGGGTEGGNVTPSAEFNIACDPEAAARVFSEDGLHRVLVGLNVTSRTTVDGAWLRSLGESGALGAALSGLVDDYLAHYSSALGEEAILMHDSLAVAEAIRPGIVRTEELPVQVDTTFGPGRGATIADRRPSASGAHLTEVATEADVPALRELLRRTLTQGR